MSPTLVSSCLDFNEKFQHKDLTVPNVMAFDQSYLEMVAARINELPSVRQHDLPALSGIIPANIVGKPPVSRRHSSSNFSTTTSKPSQLAHFAETSIYGNLPGNTLETLAEEGFRSRTFSDGSALLSNAELVHEQQQSATSRYKTELCRPFEESGKCKYGDKCQFAHGKHELRQMVRHPKYKTELCRTYHTSGLCPYGPRCHFIHNQDESAAVGGAQQQAYVASPGIQLPVSVAVPVAKPIQRQSSGNRPSNLQLVTQQRCTRRMNSSYSCSPPYANSPALESSLPFMGVNDTSLLSPASPISKSNGQIFNYGKAPMTPLDVSRSLAQTAIPEHRQTSPPLTPFRIIPGQRTDLTFSDDLVFDGPLTPPDSDRESATGSPPGFGGQPTPCPQRLPIFRCLSQSE